MNSKDILVEASGVSLKYDDNGRVVYACREIDLSVTKGEFLGILGPSGSGKSSLLYLLSGLKTASDGEVRFLGSSYATMPEGKRNALRLRYFGFVFQQPYLLGYLSALENVLVGARGTISEAKELLERLDLQEKMHRLPHELSGGERQRVCVARALLGRPTAIFADEPTASLDHTNGLAVVKLLQEHKGAGALVMVTHDPTMLGGVDRVVRIEDGAIAPEEMRGAAS